MAGETLKTAAQLLAAFPDNQAGLIESVDDRDFIISSSVAVGWQEGAAAGLPFNIPIVDGVPVDILSQQTTPPDFLGNFWVLDGNFAFIPDYANQGINVPAGVSRLMKGTMIMIVLKAGGGTADYTFQGSANGVPTGEPLTVNIGITNQLLMFSTISIYDVSAGAAISAQVTGVGTGDDLTVADMRTSIETVMV